MTAPAPSTMRRDIASAYLAAATKIGSWVVISAIVYRWYGAAAFALISLIRATLSVVNYTTFGLSPAMIHLLAESKQSHALHVTKARVSADPVSIPYASRERLSARYQPIHVIYSNGLILGFGAACFAAYMVWVYSLSFFDLHHAPPSGSFFSPWFAPKFLLLLGMGLTLRLFSDVSGAVIQTAGHIAVDNALLAACDILWVVLSLHVAQPNGPLVEIAQLGEMFLVSNVALFLLRFSVAAVLTNLFILVAPPVVLSVMGSLLSFGVMVTISQLADYLYAPIDFVLINRLLDPVLAAVYSPAVQIDAGLLLLVGGVASVLLPKTAMAHAAGNVDLIRRYYLRGTLFSGGLLAIAAIGVWILSPWMFRLWLHDPMTATQVILPLVLVHTVVGGSSAVGRSVLLGMGKVKPFTLAVLSAGVANVLLSYSFVRFGGLGLKGIILGTIVVVVARCAIWQPWYVLRTLRRFGASATAFGPQSVQTTC